VEVKQIDVKPITCAELEHVYQAAKITGLCYIKDNMLVLLTGDNAFLQKWHENVTRANLSKLAPLVKELGIGMPFPKDLDERVNELKKA